MMGFISDSENTVEILISRHILQFTLNTILSCFIDLYGGHEYFTIFPALAIYTTYSGLSIEVELALLNFTTDTMAHTKRILVPIDDKEHCMRAFDCKYMTAAEYFAVAFNTVSIVHVFPSKLESV